MGEKRELRELVEIMTRLRAPDGCPWDREQSLDTLKTFLIEEAYEVLEAIEKADSQGHREELGDLLFQIVFQCQIASEQGRFDIFDVIAGIADKIRRRHPHVFGSERADTAEQVVATWERIKKVEKASGAGRSSVLDGLPRSLPALLMAHRLSERAARVGFDWTRPEQVLDKFEEEIAELKQALQQGGKDTVECELGDVMFAAANLARHVGLSAEDALRRANRRFEQRFRLVEKMAAERGLDLSTAGIEALESLWQESKRLLKSAPFGV